MKKVIVAAILLVGFQPAFAQKYMTRTGKVTFNASTPLENIEAINNETSAVLDAKTGEILFIVPIKSFKFERALMQEHFNENYMESDKFPKADFKGKVVNIGEVNMGKDGVYHVKVTGKLTIHGVTKDISTLADIVVKGGSATAESKIKIKTADYGIKIPSVVQGKIAEQIDISINGILAATGK